VILLRWPLLIVLVLLALALAGCSSVELPERWLPLEEVVERPSLPFASDRAVTTLGATVYVTHLDPWRDELPDLPPGRVALLLHEQEHAKRQLAYGAGLTAWVLRYLNDPAFRWEEERAGWALEIRERRRVGLWSAGSAESVARGLAANYDGMVSYGDALEWVRGVVAGRF